MMHSHRRSLYGTRKINVPIVGSLYTNRNTHFPIFQTSELFKRDVCDPSHGLSGERRARSLFGTVGLWSSAVEIGAGSGLHLGRDLSLCGERHQVNRQGRLLHSHLSLRHSVHLARQGHHPPRTSMILKIIFNTICAKSLPLVKFEHRSPASEVNVSISGPIST